MTDFLTYDLKVAVLITVFYMFYRLLLARETFHRVNRVVLLLTAVASFVLPLCVITMHRTVTIEAMPQVAIGEMQMETDTEQPTAPLWPTVLPTLLYMIGVAVTLGHTLLSIMKVLSLIRRNEQHRQPDGTTICVTGNAEVAPFSWMRYIVMNRDDYAAQDAAILAHERGHIRLRHSWDVLLVDLLTALQWFNPSIWMLRQDLRSIHEYEADGEVLSQGINARQYQYLLISKATGIGGYSIANGINHSTLKKRIHMMTNRKSKGSHLLKLLAIVPIVGMVLALNARTVTNYIYDEPQKQQPVKKGKKAGKATVGNKSIQVKTDAPGASAMVKAVVINLQTGEAVPGAAVVIAGSTKGIVTNEHGAFSLDAKVGDKINVTYPGMQPATVEVTSSEMKDFYINLRKEGADGWEEAYDVVDQMPEFPGGVNAMIQFLSTNVRYPKKAFLNEVQGKVVVSFVVSKNGSIGDAMIAKSVDPELDAEALRVVQAMPNWTPGKKNGEPVAVRYTVPIQFKLEGGSQESEKSADKEDVAIELDGVMTDKPMSEILKDLSSDDIESIIIDKSCDKGSPQKPVMKITTKKK